MNDVATPYLDATRRLTLAALRGLPVKIFLFGSRATGTASQHSDIDVAVQCSGALPAGTLAGLRERLEESHIPYRVDLVDLNTAEPVLRRRVLAEGVLWTE